MRCDTASGLHGELIDYHQTYQQDGVVEGVAIVLRDEVPKESRPYSVHTLYAARRSPACAHVELNAMNGRYDLTYAEARNLFDQKVGTWEIMQDARAE